MRETVKVTKWVAGGLEALLGIPIIGAGIILGLLWTPLAIMLVFHIVNLVFSMKEDLPSVKCYLPDMSPALPLKVLRHIL